MQDFALRDFPQAIGLQVPERVLGPGGPRWAEVFQKTADAFFDVRERDQAIFTALERGQGVEEEQWLVRGAFFSPAPDVDGGEAVEEVFLAGLVGRSCHGSIMAVSGWGVGDRRAREAVVGDSR